MAKVDGLHQQPRAPALRGALTIQPTRAGLVAKAWPKKRGKRLPPKQAEAMERFKEAAIICKYAPSADQLQSRKLARGSQFLPRDLQYMAIYGRLATLFFTNGERRYQMASKVDITELLDVLGFAPGTILFRGKDYWEALEPGFEGAALTIQDGLPAWGESGGGGGAGFAPPITVLAGSLGETQASYSTKGSVLIPRENFHTKRVQCHFQSFASLPDYQATIARLDGTGPTAQVVEIVATSDPTVINADADMVQNFDWDDPVELIAGQPYLIALTWLTSSDNSNLRTKFPIDARNGVWYGAPADATLGGYHYRTRALTIGATPDQYDEDAIYLNWPVFTEVIGG